MTQERKFMKLLTRVRVKFILLLTVLCLQDRHTFCSADKTKNPVCTSPECRELSNYYMANLHKDGKPCDDFFDYVCRGWEAQNPMPLDAEAWGVPHMLERKAMKFVKTILEGIKKAPLEEVELARLLYTKCMEKPYLQKREGDAIRHIMTKVGNWPMHLPKKQHFPVSVHAWRIDNSYLKISGESALFGYDILSNIDDTDRISLLLGPPESAFGMISRVKDWTRDEEKFYSSFLRKIIASVYKHSAQQETDVIDADLSHALKFRVKYTEQVLKEEYEHEEITLKEFQEWYDKEAQSNQHAMIDWFEQVRAIRVLEARPNLKLIVSKEYFSALARTLRTESNRVIANHIHLYFAERHVLLDSSMANDLDHSVIKATSEPSGSIRYENERWYACMLSNNMDHTLGLIYVGKNFPKTTQQDVQHLIGIAKNVQKAQVSESTWLDRAWRVRAMKKIDNIKTIVGYPEWYEIHKPIQEREPSPDPLDGNAVFTPYSNELSISASYLQMPIYGKNLPYVIINGATMSLLGHELYHAFDEEGILYDENAKEPFLPRLLMAKFTKKTKCFINQYSKYKEQVLHKLNFRTAVDGKVTLGEDIADVMGLKLAYLAYKQKFQSEKKVCPVLPGFENEGCDKLFFIAFANTRCQDSSARGSVFSLFRDTHSLARIRVNGAVANMKEFSDAFNCKKSDKLNLAQRCDLWKD